MQERSVRPNRDRSAEMRGRLIAAARALFAEGGYAETSTPEIVARAEVTRGALYHHFADKADLFRAVVEAESAAVAAEIEQAGAGEGDPLETGARAFFAAMAVPGRARLMLIDGPAVLGRGAMDAIDGAGGRATLAAGLAAARPDASPDEIAALALVLSAAFDRAALAVADGADPGPFVAAMLRLVRAAAS